MDEDKRDFGVVTQTYKAVIDAVNSQEAGLDVELLFEGVCVALAKMMTQTFTMDDANTREKVYEILLASVGKHVGVFVEMEQKASREKELSTEVDKGKLH